MSQTFYKYKSFDNFEFVLDLLLRERLYASSYDELNDPMEGVIDINETISNELLPNWKSILLKLKICCFSKDPNNSLLWAHYADGGRGILVEFEVPNGTPCYKVNYSRKPKLGKSQLTIDNAMDILKYKDKAWKYEREYRCILEDEQYLNIKVKKVYLGPKVSEDRKKLLYGILNCCKPELKAYQLKGRGEELFKGLQLQHGMTKTYVKGQNDVTNCPKCSQTESYREDLFLTKRN